MTTADDLFTAAVVEASPAASSKASPRAVPEPRARICQLTSPPRLLRGRRGHTRRRLPAPSWRQRWDSCGRRRRYTRRGAASWRRRPPHRRVARGARWRPAIWRRSTRPGDFQDRLRTLDGGGCFTGCRCRGPSSDPVTLAVQGAFQEPVAVSLSLLDR
jgi:hypothetical protein